MMLSAEPEILPYRAQDKNTVLALSLERVHSLSLCCKLSA